MRNRPRGGIIAAVVILAATAATAQSVFLVTTNDTWRHVKGTGEPAPGDLAAWRTPAFVDTSWTEARAPFWYGEPGMFGGTGTELGDMQNAYSTLYLRRRFSVNNPAAYEALQLQAICDDGFLAWINGTPVASSAPPAGIPAFDSLAGANAAEPVAYADYDLPDPASVLVAGENVLAVQVFNTSLGSSDLVFDGQLTATPRVTGAPVVATVAPVPGPVTALPQITITFSEPVRGVRAEDFLVNGASATGVSGSGATYTFTFPPPPFGPIELSWSTFHTIEDFESPPRRFEIAAPGSTWAYELIDPDGPSVLVRQPPAGSRIQSLTQIEVTFNKAVSGVDAADLAVNGIAATNVSGLGAGPYVFVFPPIGPGAVQATFVNGHGILSDALEPHAFVGDAWEYQVDPGAVPPPLVLTEFMAENFTSLRDEDNDPEDWIEIFNPTTTPVPLEGWSLSNDADEPGQWVFPAVSLAPGGYLVVFASAKDRRPTVAGQRLHTNFKLNPHQGYIGIHPPELPRRPISEVRYDEQGPNYAYGRENGTGDWRFFPAGSPGTRNGVSPIRSAVADVHFSVPRGFFARAFNLSLACPTPGASIRFTTNGSPPTEIDGFVYTDPIPISVSRVVRAAAFKANALPSPVETHTYLVNLPGSRLRLPALSLVTATNNLFGRTGIMEVSPRNTTKRGAAWERPVSVEYIQPEDNGGFQTECGLRIQGGDYVRGQYNYKSTALPFSKYSFRLYFRGEYGQGRLGFPLFPETTQASFDTVVLRAGMNDHSNPFLTDEFVRSLARDCNQPASAGTFVHLFLNGVYKGYYNPCERIDVDYLRAYHGGGEKWDVMAQAGEVREGDSTAWNTLRTFANSKNLADPVNYRDIAGRLDLTNFVDYLLPLIYVDNDDWPHNNWRAARERVPGGLYRLYVWDAEWACGIVNGHPPSWDTIRNQLSSTSPPWGGADIQRIFLGLKKSPEFRQFFADRVHRHFFNGGALTDERLRIRYASVTNRLQGVVSGFNNRIGTTWIPQRRRLVLQHLERAGLSASTNAPGFNQFGGRVPDGFLLTMTNVSGTLLFTTNGIDPRVAFTGAVHTDARPYSAPIRLTGSLRVLARSLQDTTNWSALTEAAFEVDRREIPLAITEIMFNPPGGDAFEFIELANLGANPVQISGDSFTGIEFRFPNPSPVMPPGARWILASNARPSDFTARYPDVAVAGWFDGALNNGGERLELLDPEGRLITAVQYHDDPPWPASADGAGSSLERVTTEVDPDDPAAWVASAQVGGSPGVPNPAPTLPAVRLTEITAAQAPALDWLELHNAGPAAANLAGWSLSDDSNPRRFVFPSGTSLNADGWLRVWCATNAPVGELKTDFALDRDGETLSLYDASGNRVDAVTFGTLPDGYSLGRLGAGDAWTLTEPTPLAANERATLAANSRITINEWLANPPPGEDDWIELHNSDPLAPVSLHGTYLATSNALHRILAQTYIPPSGFLTLRADASPGPNHVAFHLPADGGAIVLYDVDGSEITRVTYRAALESVSVGRLPNATGEPVAMPGTASPGSSNYVVAAAGPRLNEFMARNTSAVRDAEGRIADWIELHNPGATAYDLAGASVTAGESGSRAWTFPQGFTIAANGFLVLWCDPLRAPSTGVVAQPNLGFALPGEGAALQLFNASGQRLDALHYGAQLENLSAGRSANGWALLAAPTPNASNAGPAPLGSPAAVRINEWLAGSPQGDDWIELHNPAAAPVDLGGCLLTDDPSVAGVARTELASLTFIPGHGYGRWLADGHPDGGPDHLDFSLDALGETIRLYGPSRDVIDSVDFTAQPPDTAAGRFPDGADQWAVFVDSASPGEANWLPHDRLVVTEVLAHTDPPLEDAIEVYNPSPLPVSLEGWFLSNDASRLQRQRLRGQTIVPPDGRHVLYEIEFNPLGDTNAFTLNSAHGDEVWLSEANAAGELTGYRAHARLSASANGVSFGRYRTSVGWDFPPLSRRTFGKDLPTSLGEFRSGRGLPNAYPLVGPVVLSEIHYRPLGLSGTNLVELPEDEFIELYNGTASAVPLYDVNAVTNTWRIRGGIDFDFPGGIVLPGGGLALVVSFSPTNSVQVGNFRARRAVPSSVPLFGPFTGRLANEGEEIRIERPDTPQAPPSPDAGFVPYLLVERVVYGGSPSWPVGAPAADVSLQRRRFAEFANDPANWIAAPPSAGIPTPPPAVDRDFDGLPNDWELANALDPDNPADALLDSDHDGLDNLAEFIAGTDPRDAASTLALTLRLQTSAGPAVQFRAAAFLSYSVLQRDDSGFGTWHKRFDIPAEVYDRDVTLPLGSLTNNVGFLRLVTPAER